MAARTMAYFILDQSWWRWLGRPNSDPFILFLHPCVAAWQFYRWKKRTGWSSSLFLLIKKCTLSLFRYLLLVFMGDDRLDHSIFIHPLNLFFSLYKKYLCVIDTAINHQRKHVCFHGCYTWRPYDKINVTMRKCHWCVYLKLCPSQQDRTILEQRAKRIMSP